MTHPPVADQFVQGRKVGLGVEAVRPVDVEQVDGLDAEVLAAFGDALADVLGREVRFREVTDFRGHEHLLARHLRPVERLADDRLVFVHSGRVDVAIADVERRANRLDA